MPTLSDRNIQKIEPPATSRKLVFDDHKDAPRGFGLRISPKGKKTFVLRYNVEGKDRLLSIGTYPTWSIAAARKRASELKRDTDGGIDILQARRDSRAESTVKDVAGRFCKRHADKLKSGPAIRGALDRHVIPVIGKNRITSVRRRDIIEIVETLAETRPRQAALVLTYCKQLFEWAEDREILEINPIASLRAQRISKNMKNRKRDRVLTDGEIRTLWEKQPDGMSKATWLALKFMLATGQRGGEIVLARCSELRGKTWTVPALHRGKTEDDHDVPLSETALEILKQAAGKTYLFERYRNKPMTENALNKAVLRCRSALGNDTASPWKPHDLRRTMRTALSAAGVSETVAELTIGHVRKGIESVYDQHRYAAEKRAAMEAWERRLLRILAGNPADDSKVVAMVRPA